MNSTILKKEALFWLRYKKRYELVCTEVRVGHGIADVYAIGPDWKEPTSAIEIETKISAGDLRRDFEDKSAKHFAIKSETRFSPNYFYFMVPMDLKELALELVAQHNPKYGVLTLGKYDFEPLIVVKKASKLHKERPTNHIIGNAVLRMGSEICLLHKKVLKNEKNSN